MANVTGPITGSPVSSTDRHTTAQLPVGTVLRSGAREYTYAKAGAAIALNDAVRFQGSAEGYDDVRATSAAGQYVVGGVDAAFASGDYGLIVTKGLVTIKVVVGTAAAAPLMTNTTAGTLAIADATAIAFRGAIAAVTGVAAGSSVVLL
jgi:hypothetical protein